MQYMTTAEIREKYLNFFEEKGCKRVPSSSLIPDDPSLLLTSAGMVQFKPYFLQQKQLEAPYIGTTTVQKCVRTNDIDIIGTTGRHLSFFEMLGNFSFGEYFKEEMCAWAYEFSTEVLGLPPERCTSPCSTTTTRPSRSGRSWACPRTISRASARTTTSGAPAPPAPAAPARRSTTTRARSSAAAAPTARRAATATASSSTGTACSPSTTARRTARSPLPKKNIDTGMGLERIAAIMQGVAVQLRDRRAAQPRGGGRALTGATYGEDAEPTCRCASWPITARSVTFMIADGILPSNEGRGYVLRRLLRRAVMKGQLLGLDRPFLNDYVDEIVRAHGRRVPRDRGEPRAHAARHPVRGGALRRHAAPGPAPTSTRRWPSSRATCFRATTAFTLHDTYGFPVEVTEEICDERGIEVDMEGFEPLHGRAARARPRRQPKDAEAAWSTYGGVLRDPLKDARPHGVPRLYATDAEARVLALVKDGAQRGRAGGGRDRRGGAGRHALLRRDGRRGRRHRRSSRRRVADVRSWTRRLPRRA